MGASYIPNPYIDSRQSGLTNFAQQMIAQIQAQQDERAKQDQLDKARQDVQSQVKAKQFLSLPADQQASNVESLDEGTKSYILNMKGFAPHTATAHSGRM